MPFRRALIWIRNQYLTKPKDLFLYAGVASLVMAGLSFLADFFLPWDQWAVFIRALIALPEAAAFFVLGYGATLWYVEYKERTKENYSTWRSKLSPTMRQRASAIAGAVLFVVMFAVTQQPGYTFVAGIIVAIVIGLFAFMRRTSQELARDSIGLPDARDASLNSHIQARVRANAAKRSSNSKKDAKEAKKQEKADEIQAARDLEKRLETPEKK